MPTEISVSETRLNTSCGWFYSATNSSFGGWIRVAAVSSCGDWIQVTADSILWLTRVLAAGYELRPTLPHGWLEFWRLDTSCRWLRPTADPSSGSSIRVAADSILRLTWVLYFNISSKFKDLFCKIHHFYGSFSTVWFQLPLIQVLAAAWRTLKKLEEASKL